MAQSATAFFSYSSEDSDFALRLAGDLKAAPASVWLDRLDITPGDRWDRAVEDALTNCTRMLVILSPASVSSTNVMDEVSFALEEQKTVIPVVYQDCTIPFRLRRVQHVDFRQDYARGVQQLLKILAPGQTSEQSSPASSDIGSERESSVSDAVERQRAAEQARLEEEHRKAEEKTRLEEERKQATERARAEEERKRAAEHARLQEERRKEAEQVQRAKAKREKAEEHAQEKVFSTASRGPFSTSQFARSRVISPTMLRSIGAGAIILIVAIGLWFVSRSPSPAPQKPDTRNVAEIWNPRNSRTQNSLNSIFGTSDGRCLWAVGYKGTILKSDDGGEDWNPRNSRTQNGLDSIFGTSDGRRLWAVGYKGTILESDDGGEHWNPRTSGTTGWLASIFGTSDGRRLWAVGFMGTILEADVP